MTVVNFEIGYTEPALFEQHSDPEGGGVLKRALVAVEGSFKDSNGREHVFSSNRLMEIADSTNAALEKGTVIPLCTDHKKEFGATVGSIEGKAYTKTIEASDLPNSKSIHLLGKVGLFFNDVSIKARDAAEKVRDGIVTSVSMGLNLDPKDHRIVELSLVPIPAIPNMGLFSMLDASKDNAVTWEDLESTQQTLDDMREEYDELVENLWTLLNNTYTNEAIDITDIDTLKQYVLNALNGFSIRAIDMLGLTETESMAQDPGTMTADQTQQMKQIQQQDATQGATAQYRRSTRKVAQFSRVPKYSRVGR
jgi:hypothetical protein